MQLSLLQCVKGEEEREAWGWKVAVGREAGGQEGRKGRRVSKNGQCLGEEGREREVFSKTGPGKAGKEAGRKW